MAEDARPAGCRKLSGREGWRIRIGAYRMIYEIDETSEEITVLDIGHRREAQAEGIARAKAEGKYQGRANGTSLSDAGLVEKHADIVGELAGGQSIRRTARLTGRAKSTVQRVKKAWERLEGNVNISSGL